MRHSVRFGSARRAANAARRRACSGMLGAAESAAPHRHPGMNVQTSITVAGIEGDPAPSHRLSLAHIAAASGDIDQVFLDTPQYRDESLSAQLGCDLTLKVETVNPLRCFKGRGAEFLLAQRAASTAGALVCASAGNFGQALAYACRRRGVALTVYAVRNANALKVERMRALGAEVRLHGDDFDAAKEAARAWAATAGVAMFEDGRDAEIAEGAGTIAVEMLAGGAAFDAVLVPLGDGALLAGMARWIKARSPSTRVIGVCASGADVMARIWRAGLDAAWPARTRADTIADGIACTVPVREAVAHMRGIVDDVVAVRAADFIAAMRLIHEHTGLVVEPSGAAGVAALIAAPGRYAGQRVATVLTGGNVVPEQFRRWLYGAD